jgi:dienelactone hydrolase
MKRATTAVVVTVVLSLTLTTHAQRAPAEAARPTAADRLHPPTPADFGQWERLVTSADHGGLSPDAKWLTYGINRTSRDNELRVVSLGETGHISAGTPKVIAFGSGPVFSADSRWLAAAVGLHETQEEKLRKEKKPIHRKLALLRLATGDLTFVDGVESFAFSADGSHLLIRRYAPERTDKEKKDADPAAAADPEDPPGSTAIVRELSSGRDTTFGNVSDAAWQTKGKLLALTISAEDRAGDGVHVFDPSAGTLRVLDSASARYLGLAWRKDADDLAVLKSKTDDHRDGSTYAVMAWTAVGHPDERKHQYDPATDAALGTARRTVAFRKPVWSEDGTTLFVGTAAWLEKLPDAKDGKKESAGEEDDPPSVDVWHSHDVDVMPRQKVNAKRDRERSLLAAWHLDSSSLVPLAHDFEEVVAPLKAANLAYAVSWNTLPLERSWGRFGNASLSLIDTTTGKRTPVVERLDDRFVRPSPDGKYILYYLDGHYWTLNTAQRRVTNITRTVATSFADRDSDSTDVQKPWYGIAGWTEHDQDVLLYDKFDIWQVAPDGSKATRLTDGSGEQVRYRYADVDSEHDFIDRTKPIYLDLFGTWTKKSGVARLMPGSRGPERLVWLDRGVDHLAKAKNADVYTYVVQAFDDSPDAFVGNPDLAGATQVTSTNPFQSRFAWGHAELVEYKSERGAKLQGVLRYPAAYERARKYPMVVYVYEKRSDGLHQYSAPSEREYYNASTFTSAGYFFFEPDIVFRPREPGVSVVECVRPAVAAVAALGVIDAKRVGVVGHSWGGFDTTYLATHSDIFAAAVAGAPITDLVSNYGNHHWGPGIAETDHIETGQQRMEVPLWEDLPAYTRNSAVFGAATMTTPLLIEVGDADGTVFWHQGVELYNVARRAKKDVVLLVYANEDHGLRQKSNQIDYHRRILQWFDHYLKGEPAPAWMTNGVSYLDKERDARVRNKKGS